MRFVPIVFSIQAFVAELDYSDSRINMHGRFYPFLLNFFRKQNSECCLCIACLQFFLSHTLHALYCAQFKEDGI